MTTEADLIPQRVAMPRTTRTAAPGRTSNDDRQSDPAVAAALAAEHVRGSEGVLCMGCLAADRYVIFDNCTARAWADSVLAAHREEQG
jgi:hypothetical protein